jgi:transposase
MRFDLSDEDWAHLEPLLPKSRKSARVDDRKIMPVGPPPRARAYREMLSRRLYPLMWEKIFR